MLIEDQWLDILLRGFLLAMIALAWVVVLVRIVGLRSLSKMTSFDFVMTVALGSLVAGASQAEAWTGFVQPLVGMAGLFFAQWLTAQLRKSSDAVEDVLQNEPVLLMRDGKILHRALETTRVAEGDLIAKLREANVMRMEDVRAAVLETTGDVSVLHGDSMKDEVLRGVKRAD